MYQTAKKLKRLKVDYSLVTVPIDYKDFNKSIVLIDDVDTFKDNTKEDKQIKLALKNIKDDCLELGRDQHITALISSHLACKGHETKTLLNEAHKIFIYPSSGCNYNYLLTKFFGLSTKAIKRVKSLPSRWVCLCRMYPQVLFTENQVMPLTALEE